ncbi:MAG: alpha/beta fold hydrolase [Terrimicrobiaceae bacterium]|nr:alpha/beta fold hydrolase [Terrimicrobiaceae bacterium]
MPLIEHSSYVAPLWLRSGHAQTIFAGVFRRVPWITRERERIATPDGDFLDLDWNRTHRAARVAIVSHGLEGESRNACVQGMAAALHRAGWDVLAWNFRGCGGEPNRLLRSYHSGATEDLQAVIGHALAGGQYARAALVGFSLGGNLTLKYLGDLGATVDFRVDRAVTFSAPCDLAASSVRLESQANRIYMGRFLRGLRAKIREKMRRFPGELTDAGLDAMRTFREFDGAYTAPLHGFRSAEDYWARASSRPVLDRIAIPTLLVNARNDPFLPAACFPEEAARASAHFHLEAPRGGGHIGFVSFNARNEYWSETRAVAFLE